MLRITKPVADVGIVVRDIDRSLAFYEGILGLERSGKIAIPKEDALRGKQASTAFTVHMLKLGEQLIKLVELPTSPPGDAGMIDAAPGYRYITLSVKSVKQEYEKLKKLGASFLSEPLTPRPGLSLVFMTDPDGNYIELIGGE